MSPLDEAVARLRKWAGNHETLDASDTRLVLAELDRRGAELERLRERDAKAREHVWNIYAHYSDAEASKAGVGSQLWHQRQALALLKEEPNA